MTKKSCPFQAIGFIETFRLFRSFVDSCFGQMLNDRFLEKIQQFKKSCLVLPVTMTLKAYAVFYHVSKFLEHYGTSLFSEQATETKHSIFKDCRKVILCQINQKKFF